MIESQYGILVDKINSMRDFEAICMAHDQFVSALLAQSFIHTKSVSKSQLILIQCTLKQSWKEQPALKPDICNF